MHTTDNNPKVERTDIPIVPVLKFLFWMGVGAIVVHGGMWVLYKFYLTAPEPPRVLPPASAMTIQSSRLPDPKKPKLQMDPIKEMKQERAQELLEVEKGFTDKTAGLTGIPIEKAIEKTVENGLPARTVDQNVSAGLVGTQMPGDSSAGRTNENRLR